MDVRGHYLGVWEGAQITAAVPGHRQEEGRSCRHLGDLTDLPCMRKLPISSGVTSLYLVHLPSRQPEVCTIPGAES